jgi:two-component system cell cycle response regulator
LHFEVKNGMVKKMKTNPLQPVALIVTNDISTATFLRKVLRLTFQLIERQDASSAQEIVRSTSVDLILLDSKDLDEEALFLTLSRFRSSLGKKKTPILLITGNLKKKFAQDALRAGATDFINQPLEEDEIEQRIAVAFQSFERTKNISEVAKRSTPGAQTASSSLTNRQFLNDQAIKEISKARQNEGHVSLLIIELDVKKAAPPSEEAHLHLMSLLQSNIRKHDILIPQSTGKFVIMLPKTSERAAELIAESIRMDVEKKISPLSVSIGLITWDHARPSIGSAAEEFDHLIDVATQAVQEAKKTGNRIITSESP